MRDAQTVLHAKGLHPLNIERTDVQPGQRYFVGHRVVRMGDPLPVVVPVDTSLDTPMPHGRYGQHHPIVVYGPLALALLAVVMIGAAVLDRAGWW